MNASYDSFDIDAPHLPKAIKRAALRSDGYPYDHAFDAEDYKDDLTELQRQLVLLQDHLLKSGERIIIVFEGRDAAGKGGTIKRYLQHLNPRYNIHAALPKPNDRESTQWYFQRYVDWFPAAGETVLFDRSWYNRAGVEPVMGFCTQAQTDHFLEEVPHFERMIVNDGIHFFKFWLSIGREMQIVRFHKRRHNPLKTWKISPVDRKALDLWDEYSRAIEKMLRKSDTDFAPWLAVRANDKRRTHLNVIRAVLGRLDYTGKDRSKIGEVDNKIVLSAKQYLAEHLAG
ncbi:MAG TPA: polyphosphate kinase 2 [Devosia sp.]|nr:polyphosphate kinase 2 [Devosia sp.]